MTPINWVLQALGTKQGASDADGLAVAYDHRAARAEQPVQQLVDTHGRLLPESVHAERAQPSLSGAKIGQLMQGDEFYILADEPVSAAGYWWERIRLDGGATGWFAASLNPQLGYIEGVEIDSELLADLEAHLENALGLLARLRGS